MIFETKKEDLLLRVKDIVEVFRYVTTISNTCNNEEEQIYFTEILTKNSKRIIKYDSQYEWNYDYSKLKKLMSK